MSATALLVAADAAPGVGLGHLSRSGSIVEALRERGASVAALSRDAREASEWRGVRGQPAPLVDLPARARGAAAVILDSYHATESDAEAIAVLAPLAVFNDVDDPVRAASLVIAPSRDAPGRDDGARWLVGFEHAPLGPAFRDAPPPEIADEVRSVLVSTGGGDPGGHGAALARTVAAALPGAEVRLIRGPDAALEPPAGVVVLGATENLAEALGDADLALIAAGNTLLEACALGTPSLAVVAVPNQARSAARLQAQGAIETIDPGDPELGARIADVAGDPARRREMSDAARAAVDGRGADRVAGELLALTR